MSEEEEAKRAALVISKDPYLRDLVIFSLQSNFSFKIIQAQTDSDAVSALLENPDIALILCDQQDDFDQILPLLNIVKQLKKPLPFYLISDADTEGIVDFKQKNISAVVKRDDCLKYLRDLITSNFVEDTSKGVNEFTPVYMRTLIHLKGIDEDIYIRLSSGRYLRIFAKSDQIEQMDVDRYAQKGVHELYLKRSTGTWVLRELEKNFPRILPAISAKKSVTLEAPPAPQKDPKPPPTEAAMAPKVEEKVFDVTEGPFQYDKEYLQEVADTIEKTTKLVKQNPVLAQLLKKLQLNRSQSEYYENHVKLLCNISCGIAQMLEWKTQATLEKIVFVCFVHDLALAKAAPLSEIVNIREFEMTKSKLTPSQQRLFLNHPKFMADFCPKIRNAPNDADVIILQHHELPDGTGFPNRISGTKLTPLSCLFILAEDFVHYILKNPQWQMKNYIPQAKTRFRGITFQKIIQALDRMK